ncbi:MAG: hypothetical protein SGILL_001332 [Bacillariaceae sp.]
MRSTVGDEEQAIEAIRSLADFHQGEWKGRARSFSVTPDVAAGVVQRKNEDYKVAVKLTVTDTQQFSLSETMSWDDSGKVAFRSLPLEETDFDIDSEDASYSLDTVQAAEFPAALSGTEKSCVFLIEHCIATGEDRRARCFAFYGEDESLMRIVISNEERIQRDNAVSGNDSTENSGALTAKDLLEMQNDVDRLVDKIVSSMDQGDNGAETISPPVSENGADAKEEFTTRLGQLGESFSSSQGTDSLALYDISLLELSSGVWLGDAIIRDSPGIAESPDERGRGFGSSNGGSADEKDSWKSKSSRRLGDWDVGVQKIAWRWMWDFGEEIRQVNDVGKALGSSLQPSVTNALAGNVCVDESLSRRIPKGERMVYIDWECDSVGFLTGPFSVQLPRYINFDPTASTSRTLNKPFMTEFCVFQTSVQGDKEKGGGSDTLQFDDDSATDLPELSCAKLNRYYNFEGRLKQGFSSYYTLQHFESKENSA